MRLYERFQWERVYGGIGKEGVGRSRVIGGGRGGGEREREPIWKNLLWWFDFDVLNFKRFKKKK